MWLMVHEHGDFHVGLRFLLAYIFLAYHMAIFELFYSGVRGDATSRDIEKHDILHLPHEGTRVWIGVVENQSSMFSHHVLCEP